MCLPTNDLRFVQLPRPLRERAGVWGKIPRHSERSEELQGLTTIPFSLRRADLRTDDARSASPDSENIELARTEGSKAKLFERGGNPRQS